MKNILIMGVGRTGKTTLSNMIKKKYNQYNLIHSDSIKWALIRAQEREDYYRNNIKAQKKFEHSEYFQKILLEFFNSCIRNDKNKYGYILESGQLDVSLVKKYVDFNNTIVFCLGHGCLSKEEIIDLCIKHDDVDDWTFSLSSEYLDIHAQNWDVMNKKLREDCRKYNISYVDTSNNRDEVLEDILGQL